MMLSDLNIFNISANIRFQFREKSKDFFLNHFLDVQSAEINLLTDMKKTFSLPLFFVDSFCV